jgi:hypothetical protein
MIEKKTLHDLIDYAAQQGPITDDDLLALGLITPADHFLAKRFMGCQDAEKLEDTHRHALVDLLRSDVPLDRRTRNWIAGELERLSWPNPEAEKRARRQAKAYVIRKDLDAAIAENKQAGVVRPVKAAKDKVAVHWGHQSGDALRKELQPNRVNRRSTRRRPRG